MNCNTNKAIEELAKLLNLSSVKNNKTYTDELTKAKNILEIVATNMKNSRPNQQPQVDPEYIESIKDSKVYSKLGRKSQTNAAYTGLMTEWLKSQTDATIEKVSNILNQKMILQAGEYNSKTHKIKILDKPSNETKYMSARNSLLDTVQGKVSKDVIDEILNGKHDGLVKDVAKDLEEILEIDGPRVVLHELVHANTMRFMGSNPEHTAVIRIKELYEIAKDRYGDIVMVTEGDTYWMESIDEFVAEGLSNGKLMYALSQIEVTNKKPLGLMQEFIKMVVDMLELKKTDNENVYTLMLDAATVMVDEQVASETKQLGRQVLSKNYTQNIQVRNKVEDSISKTEEASVDTYQKTMIEMISKITGVKVETTEDVLKIAGLYTGALSVETAKYTPATNTINVLPDKVTRAVEQKVRSEVYSEYMAKNGIEPEEFSTEIINAAEKETMIDIESVAKGISSYIESTDKQQELTHEMIHAGVLGWMTDPANADSIEMVRMKELYELALASKVIIDAGMEENGVVNAYWASNIHEFVAEGLSNPKLIKVLSRIEVKGKDTLGSIFKEFIKVITDMLGLDGKVKDNMYEYLLDGYMATVERSVSADNDYAINKQIVAKMTANIQNRKQQTKDDMDRIC